MSELTLYRKYRPQTFKDVEGQDQVVKVLESSIKNGTVSHAYLFAGSRGTGKTSVARIFARALKSSPEDIYEMDAASNRGIDEVRALREAVHTLPYSSPYKVYIIDEAHMLTREAWNALLKTLEEPPKHVIFIFATTELDKVIETVISRCQVFVFKKPTHKILRDMVVAVAKAEGFTLEPSSADLIASLGEGSFRDAQSILQKIFGASKDKKISVEEVELITGAPQSSLINAVIEALDEKDLSKGLESLNKAVGQNIDMKVFSRLLLEKLRLVLLLRFARDMEEGIKESLTETDFNFLKTIAGKKGSNISSATLNELIGAADAIRYASVPQLPLELALVSLLGQKS